MTAALKDMILRALNDAGGEGGGRLTVSRNTGVNHEGAVILATHL